MTFCRFCQAELTQTLVDLGDTPLANAYLPDDPAALAAERRFPLRVMVCHDCWLVQTTETVPSDVIFDHDYAYLSSYSQGWVAHAKTYAEMMTQRFRLDEKALVVEVASNDGYLLQHFGAMDVPVLGIEPAGHAAELAEAKGIPTRVEFFGKSLAEELVRTGIRANVIASNNVLAHVPDIRDFAHGFKTLLKHDGVATFEFPHLANLIDHVQFDTIYHEHYSYLSLLFVERLMADAGLQVFDVEELPTHGGSLRVFVGHPEAHDFNAARIESVRNREAEMSLASPKGYEGFQKAVRRVVDDLRTFLEASHKAGKTVAGYGAAAKGNTFLNVAGIDHSLISFVADRNPEKQNKLLPGSHIPVRNPQMIAEKRPDYLVIFPWNIAAEVKEQQSQMRSWGGKFVVAVPTLEVS